MTDMNHENKSFREKYLNKRVILIALGIAVVLGVMVAAGLLKASENPSFCKTCHIIRPFYESWNEGIYLDHKHALENIECLDCHHRTIPEKAMAMAAITLRLIPVTSFTARAENFMDRFSNA